MSGAEKLLFFAPTLKKEVVGASVSFASMSYAIRGSGCDSSSSGVMVAVAAKEAATEAAAEAAAETVAEAAAEATAATALAAATEGAAATKAAARTKGAGATEGAVATAVAGGKLPSCQLCIVLRIE